MVERRAHHFARLPYLLLDEGRVLELVLHDVKAVFHDLHALIGIAEGGQLVRLVARIQHLTDEATKMLSAMRENDSAHTVPDTYRTAELGFVTVL